MTDCGAVRRHRRLAALVIALALVLLFCGSGYAEAGTEALDHLPPAGDAVPAGETAAQPAGAPVREEISVAPYLKAPEYFTREINGAETSLYHYEGDGWCVDVPSDWTPVLGWLCWNSPSGNASFSVNPCTASAQSIKAYQAEMGSWVHQTGMPAPLDEYYDGGLHSAPPDSGATRYAQYEYYHIPVSDSQSYQLVCSGVWDITDEAEWALLHTMVESFTVDADLHSVNAGPYLEGYSELAAALAGLADPENPVWLYLAKDGYGRFRDGRSGGQPWQYADALRAFEYTLVRRDNNEPTPEELRDRADICLSMEELGSNLYVYEGSSAVYLYWRGTAYWFTAADPDRPGVSPYEAAYAWVENAGDMAYP